jgi:SAM-dependent methyltransferase
MQAKNAVGRFLKRTGRLVEKVGNKLERPSNGAFKPFNEWAVFFTPEALTINKARLDHLGSLGLDLSGKSVLEVGAGIGLHTVFFEDRGCNVLCTDGNPKNVAEMIRRYPSRRVQVLDLDQATDLSYLGEFHLVYSYGTLYHLSKPEQALKALAGVCLEMILLETCVSLGKYAELHLVREPPASNQSVSGIGSRPTRLWIMQMLRTYFGHAYITRTQPRHPDFELDWRTPAAQPLYRSVFVGSKKPITNPSLLEDIPEKQTYE